MRQESPLQASAARYANSGQASHSLAAAKGVKALSIGAKLKGVLLTAGVTVIVPVSAFSALALPPSAVKKLAGSVMSVPADIFSGDEAISQLEAADADFNTLLELGFRSSIRKEWEWRVSRGESLKNLEAFAHLIDTDDSQPS